MLQGTQLVVLYEIPEGAKLSTKIDFYITLDIGLLWWTWHTSSEFHDRSKCTHSGSMLEHFSQSLSWSSLKNALGTKKEGRVKIKF